MADSSEQPPIGRTLGEVLAAIRQHGSPASPCVDAASVEVHLRACRQLMHLDTQELLQSSTGNSILLQFSMDTTPMRTRQEIGQYSGKQSGRRAVKKTVDYLVQQLFLTVQTPSGLQNAVLFGPPLVLKHGKTMAQLLPCALQCPGIDLGKDLPMLIRIKHQVHDRAISHGLVGGLSGFWMQGAQAGSQTARRARFC